MCIRDRVLPSNKFAIDKPIAVTLEPDGTDSISTGTTPTPFTTLFLKNVAMLYPKLNTNSNAMFCASV